jgi:F-type H+-transporting ATPase subunit a
MAHSEVFAQELLRLGPLTVSDSLATSLAVTLLLWLAARLLARRLREEPGALQVVAEGIVGVMEDAVRAVLPRDYVLVTPFIMSLWLFLLLANLIGLIPGLHSPTRDLSVTAALAILVFLSVHWFGVRSQGWRRYLRHYLVPTPILLPFHLISEVTRTVALAVRLFGNMMSLELTALLVLLVAGFLAPVPILMLHVVEALVQAYIFGMLALIYIAGAIQSQQAAAEREAPEEGK